MNPHESPTFLWVEPSQTLTRHESLQVPKKHFTVGINDDVTNTSLPVGPTINTQDPEVTQAPPEALQRFSSKKKPFWPTVIFFSPVGPKYLEKKGEETNSKETCLNFRNVLIRLIYELLMSCKLILLNLCLINYVKNIPFCSGSPRHLHVGSQWIFSRKLLETCSQKHIQAAA